MNHLFGRACRCALALALGASLLVDAHALAQDAPPPPPLVSGKAEASFVSTSGNTSTQSLGLGLELEAKPAPWAILFKASHVQAEAEGLVTARASAASIRGSRALSPRLDLFVQGGWDRNTFAGIDARWAGEVGAAYKALATPVHTLKVEAGFGVTQEDRINTVTRPGPPPVRIESVDGSSFGTARGGLGYKWQISKTADFTEEASFTLNLKDGDDWRFANVASVTAAISSVFSLKASHKLQYLNFPATGKGKTDTVTSAALVAKF